MSQSTKDSDSDSDSSSSSEHSEYTNKDKPVSSTQQPLFGSSQGSGSSQSKGSRVWRLANAEMRIIDFSVKSPGRPMNIKMEFVLKNGTKKIVDLPYTNESMKNCKKIIINKCEQFMWLEGLASDKQDKYFPDFIDQQIQKFDETNNPAITTRKNMLELSSPAVEKIGDAYYWIAGSGEVHLLNHERNAENKFYARKLSPDEIADLPVEIVYVGTEDHIFLADEEKAFTILVSIIEKMNSMQDPKFVSFPLGKFCAQLAACLYPILQESHKGFSTTVTLSGSGNTPQTGKSLTTSWLQLALLGGWPKQTVFSELEQGNTIFLREWANHGEILNLAIQMVWERLGRKLRGVKYQAVNSVVMIDANLSPSDIHLDHANESKVIFLATGSQELRSDKKIQLCQEMEDLSRELYTFKPVLLGLGLSCMLKKVTDAETVVYDGLLKKDRCDRESQVFLHYDRVHTALEEAIDEYGLEKPLLFKKNTIDRTTLTFYNNREDALSPEEMAEVVAAHIVDSELADVVEYSAKTKSFRLKLSPTDLQPDIASALRGCTKETSTVFGGKIGVKVRLLSAKLLSSELLSQMRSLTATYKFSDAVDRMLENKAADQALFAKEFFKQVERRAKRMLTNEVPPDDLNISDELDRDMEDLYNMPAGPSRTEQQRVPEKRKISSQSDDLKCTLTGCPCPSKNKVYKNGGNYRKHLMTVGHMNAEKKANKSKKKKK